MSERSRRWLVGIAVSGVALLLTGGVSANPALAEQLRKSTISDQAARATTVADQLAIRRFGVSPGQQPQARTYTAVGAVPTQYPWWYGYGHDPYYGSRRPRGQGGTYGLDLDNPRLPDGFDPGQYDDRKPHSFPVNGFRLGFRTGYRSGFNSGFGQSFGFGGFYDPFWSNRGWNDRFFWAPFPYGIDGRLIQTGSMLSMPAPSVAASQAPEPDAEPETEIDAARRLLAEGVYGASIERYRRHLAENPDDFEAMAELSVALAGTNRFDDATAMVRMAYERDPALAGRSVDQRVAFDSKALRKIVVRAVRSAHDRDSASGWLLVAVLMQAEDRDPVGLRMLARATDRGLEPGIADSLRAELR